MARPIRIFHITDSLTPGGTERILVDLVNGLWQQGVGVGVCVTRQDVQLAQDLLSDVPLVVLNRQTKWDLKAIRYFVREIQQRQVFLIHAHGRGSVQFASLVKNLSFPRPKLLFHDHFGEIGVDQSTPLALRKINRYFVDRYVAVDPALQKWAIEQMRLRREQTEVLPNAIDLHRFEAVEPISRTDLGITKPIVAIMVANLRPQKDHLLLFQALARTVTAREKIHLLIAGLDLADEYSRTCHQAVVELGLASQVTFLGERLDIPQLLRTADIGLLSSRSESGPVVLLEYGASSLPFVATLTGQVAHFFHDHQQPFLVQPGDVMGYAQALDALVNCLPTQRDDLVTRARQLVYDHFGVGRQVKQLLTIYNKLGFAYNGAWG